mgnify:CR=1 FL=1
MELSDSEIIEGLTRLLNVATKEQRPRIEAYLRAKVHGQTWNKQYGMQARSGPMLRGQLAHDEREVLQLVVEGLTNRQIAERLVVAEVTARDHVQRILRKLAVADRTAAAVLPRDRWARVGLVVSRLVGCEAFASECAGLLRSRGEDPSEAIAASEGAASGLGETELASIRFARDFTLHAHTITRERLRELRRAGLSDGAILDLAYVCAVFNGLARLVIALAPV